ncbi:MAG: BA14K family protein [Pararhodobacter sp.]|nr:BA14K family protein [Pararhodobacter sp.]
MKIFVSTLCAAVLSMSPIALSSASAAPASSFQLTGSVSQSPVLDDLVQAQGHRYQHNRRGADRRGHHRRGFDNRHRRPAPHRPQPRRHSSGPDLGSAVVGAIIGGALVHQFQQPRQHHQPRHHSGSFLSSEHINWCHNRWRSYRVVDNSYQPYNGPRRVCVSPYGPT